MQCVGFNALRQTLFLLTIYYRKRLISSSCGEGEGANIAGPHHFGKLSIQDHIPTRYYTMLFEHVQCSRLIYIYLTNLYVLQGPEPRPRDDYRLEFTTDQFSTNSDSELIVNLPNLDRDTPGQPMLMLQVRL